MWCYGPTFGNMQAPPMVVFDYTAWVARYPEFTNVSQTMAQAYFDEATLYFANCGWQASLPQAPTLLNMLTAHIAWLYAPRDEDGNPSSSGQTAPQLVGRISTTSEGSVSVSTDLTSNAGSPSQDFFTQTKYGFAFWQATAQFRSFRYARSPFPAPQSTAYPFFGPFPPGP
jgi:Protein of unknown function (DUF4054)